jgi:ribulose bisphosphate carboxylase small subunit
MKVQPEATDFMGDKYYIRYKRVFDVQYPLKAPYNIWVEVEDTWQQKNGQWRLISTNLVNSAVDQAKAMLEAQKKRMEYEDEQRRSQRCLNGLGYGCRAY